MRYENSYNLQISVRLMSFRLKSPPDHIFATLEIGRCKCHIAFEFAIGFWGSDEFVTNCAQYAKKSYNYAYSIFCLHFYLLQTKIRQMLTYIASYWARIFTSRTREFLQRKPSLHFLCILLSPVTNLNGINFLYFEGKIIFASKPSRDILRMYSYNYYMK